MSVDAFRLRLGDPPTYPQVMIRLLLFVALPLVEMAILVWAAAEIGFLVTVLLVMATGIAGASLVKRQGLAVWRSAQQRLAGGQLPTRELSHGAMLLVAGAFLLTPGFITDTAGFLLLVPAVRDSLRNGLGPRLAERFSSTERVRVWRV